MNINKWMVLLSLCALTLGALACNESAQGDSGDTDADADTDGDTDSDTDTDADADSDSDSDTDADTASDGDSDTNSSVDSDTGTEWDSGIDTNTDTSLPGVPENHRPEALSCVGVHDPPEPGAIWDTEFSDCSQHADCTDGVNGKCVNGLGSAWSMGFCTYDTCATDGDCDPGKICYCTSTTAARCLSIGNCQIDSDCGDEGYCSPSMSFDCGGHRPIDGYHCHTPSDTCLDDGDCTGSDYCNFNTYSGAWECTPVDTTCVIG